MEKFQNRTLCSNGGVSPPSTVVLVIWGGRKWHTYMAGRSIWMLAFSKAI